MADEKDDRLVFISYGGAIDAEIAKKLYEFLSILLRSDKAVYCTAVVNGSSGAVYGEDFAESYISNIKKAKIFIPLLSENYMHSPTALTEMGVALGDDDKKLIPFLVSDGDYGMLQPMYNIRNRELHDICDLYGLKKALHEIGHKLDREFEVNDDRCLKLIEQIDQLKTGYKTAISKNKQISIVSPRIQENKEKYQEIIEDLGQENILDICITVYKDDRITESRLYFKETKTVADLISYFNKNNIPETDYVLKEIE